MAQNYEVTPLGLRLARLRRETGLSASALADLIPSERITRAVISNIESGRKADPSFSEVALIASGLELSPLELLVELNDPWAKLDFEGLAPPYDGMTSLEYLAATDVMDFEAVGTISPEHRNFIGALNRAEEKLFSILKLRELRETGEKIADGDVALYVAGTGRSVAIEQRQIDFGEDSHDDEQELIDAYREALSWSHGRFADAFNISRVPARVLDRLDRVRLAVVEFIANDSDLDYGQGDRPGLGAPVLDPGTGAAVPSKPRGRRA